MEKEFSLIECQKIMNQLAISHYDNCISMFQNKEYKHILKVQTLSLGITDILAMREMQLSITIFASGNNVEMWLSKY